MPNLQAGCVELRLQLAHCIHAAALEDSVTILGLRNIEEVAVAQADVDILDTRAGELLDAAHPRAACRDGDAQGQHQLGGVVLGAATYHIVLGILLEG